METTPGLAFQKLVAAPLLGSAGVSPGPHLPVHRSDCEDLDEHTPSFFRLETQAI